MIEPTNYRKLEEIIERYTGAPYMKYSEYLKLSKDAKRQYITRIYNICAENDITFKIAFGNEKGGTGKTALSMNVAYMASQFGITTLALDNEPQGSMTSLLGGDLDITQNQAFKKRVDTFPKVEDLYYDVDEFVPRLLVDIDIAKEFNRPKKLPGLVPALEKAFVKRERITDDDLKDIILRPMLYLPKKSKKKNEDGRVIYTDELQDYGFDLIPASAALFQYGINLGASEQGLKKSGGNIRSLMAVLLDYQKRVHNKKYGLVICDLAPSVDIVSLNGMSFAEDGVIGVITPNYEVLNGIYNIMETVQTIESLEENHLGMPIVVLNRNIPKNVMSRMLEPATIRSMYQTRSPESRISNLMSAMQTGHNEHVLASQISSKAYDEFEQLTLEILYIIVLARLERNKVLEELEAMEEEE